MASKNTRGGGYGTFGQFTATLLDEGLTIVAMSAVFTATGATSAVPVPAGVQAALVLLAQTTGSPTSATVVVEGSNDQTTWAALPAPKTAGAQTPYAYVRLRCTALAGGSSPSLIVAAIATP